MKTITFYSYKGGVGRSLALSNIAKRLAEFGKKVCLIDFDLDAPGLNHKFSEFIKDEDVELGIVDYIYSFVENGKVGGSIRDYITQIEFKNKNHQSIDLLAAGNTNTQEYWKKLSSINWASLFYEKDSRGIEFFSNLKQEIKNELQPDFLLIDSRTGITDISGITMSILADETILVCANNKENIKGIKQIVRTISQPENNLMNEALKFHVVLSRIPYTPKANEKYKEQSAKKYILKEINEALDKEKKIKLDQILVLHSDPDLEFEEKLKIGYDDEHTKSNFVPIAIDYLQLFEQITKDVLSTEDKKKFNELRKVELLIEEARLAKDDNAKIKFLKSALQINPESYEALEDLSIVYINTKDYHSALEVIKMARDFFPDDINLKVYLGIALNRTKDKESVKEAKVLFLDILKIEPLNMFSLRELAYIYKNEGKMENSIKLLKKSIDTYPFYLPPYNNLADIYKATKEFDKALDIIYKALEVNPQDAISTGTLAELQAHLGNEREFYKNLELFFSFSKKDFNFQDIIEDDPIYKKFINESKFQELLRKYEVQIDENSL